MSKIEMPKEFVCYSDEELYSDGSGLPLWAKITIGVGAAAIVFTSGFFIGKAVAKRSALKSSSFSNLSVSGKTTLQFRPPLTPEEMATLQREAAGISESSAALYGGCGSNEAYTNVYDWSRMSK